jgi:hypothetical protein
MTLRIARLQRYYGVSEAVARMLAGMIYGGGDT